MPRTLKRLARSSFSSELTLTTFTWPTNSVASASIVGVSARHGPHQGAQKSTSTGRALCATSASQVSELTSRTCSLISFSRGWQSAVANRYDVPRRDIPYAAAHDGPRRGLRRMPVHLNGAVTRFRPFGKLRSTDRP